MSGSGGYPNTTSPINCLTGYTPPPVRSRLTRVQEGSIPKHNTIMEYKKLCSPAAFVSKIISENPNCDISAASKHFSKGPNNDAFDAEGYQIAETFLCLSKAVSETHHNATLDLLKKAIKAPLEFCVYVSSDAKRYVLGRSNEGSSLTIRETAKASSLFE